MQHYQFVIIGAGVCGLACAAQLPKQDTRIVEKSRGPGGRLSSKRLDQQRADIGAQFITARDPMFQAIVTEAQADGALSVWTPRMGKLHADGIQESPDRHPRYVGTPYMNAFGRHLAKGLSIDTETRISAVQRTTGGYLLSTTEGSQFTAAHVVCTAPVNQMQDMLVDFDVADIVSRFTMEPTWTVVLESEDLLRDRDGNVLDACFGGDDPDIDFVSVEASKPGRHSKFIVVHSTVAFARQMLELEPSEAGVRLQGIVEEKLSLRGSCKLAHRWRFARPTDPHVTAQKGIYHVDNGLWIAGDYLSGGRVEGAYLAGLEVGQRLREAVAG